MPDDKDLEDLIGDNSQIDEFVDELDASGLVVSSVDDGVVIGITSEKLQELLDVSKSNDDGVVLVFIKRKEEVVDLKN